MSSSSSWVSVTDSRRFVPETTATTTAAAAATKQVMKQKQPGPKLTILLVNSQVTWFLLKQIEAEMTD